MEIGIALGGGGSRGISHLGVLKALEENNINIGAIAGTSIGGLLGAVYLSGYSATDLIERFVTVDQPKLYRYKRSQEPALLGLGGATEILVELIGARTFDDLPIPFAVTAVDIETGQEMTINEGPLIDGVLATIAVPGILPAHRWAGRLLVDGGVANPVPVDVVRHLKPGLPVVAIVLTEPIGKTHTMKVPEFIPVAAPIVEYISKLRIAQALDIFIRSLETGSKILAEKRLELDKPDLIISPPLGSIKLLDRIDVEVISGIGYDSANAKLEQIKSLATLGSRIRSLFRR